MIIGIVVINTISYLLMPWQAISKYHIQLKLSEYYSCLTTISYLLMPWLAISKYDIRLKLSEYSFCLSTISYLLPDCLFASMLINWNLKNILDVLLDKSKNPLNRRPGINYFFGKNHKNNKQVDLLIRAFRVLKVCPSLNSTLIYLC